MEYIGYFIAFMIGGFFGTMAIGLFAGVRIAELKNELAARESEHSGKVS